MSEGMSKAQMIRQMRTTNNAVALKALDDIRERGWLNDGSMQDAELDESNLAEADMRGADLRKAAFVNANLQRANLSNADLEGAMLIGADLTGSFLDEANLQDSGLRDANLKKAFLNNANLTKARLQRVDLYGADLSSAIMHEAELMDANLRGVLLYNVDLRDAVDVTDEQLAETYAMWHCTMPDGSRYDGRFNLAGDIIAASTRQNSPGDAQSMAEFYEVSLENYERGQEWARENLSKLRIEGVYQAEMHALWTTEADSD